MGVVIFIDIPIPWWFVLIIFFVENSIIIAAGLSIMLKVVFERNNPWVLVSLTYIANFLGGISDDFLQYKLNMDYEIVEVLDKLFLITAIFYLLYALYQTFCHRKKKTAN